MHKAVSQAGSGSQMFDLGAYRPSHTVRQQRRIIGAVDLIRIDRTELIDKIIGDDALPGDKSRMAVQFPGHEILDNDGRIARTRSGQVDRRR